MSTRPALAGLTRLYQLNTSHSVGLEKDWDATRDSRPERTQHSALQFLADAAGLSYNGIGSANNAIQLVNDLQVADTYTISRGRHTVSFGQDWRKDRFTNESLGSEMGLLRLLPVPDRGHGQRYPDRRFLRRLSAGQRIQRLGRRAEQGAAHRPGFLRRLCAG
jgi:hypothetical protein